MIELPKLIAEFAAAPIRAQERLDDAWLDELAQQSFLQQPGASGNLDEFPDLRAMLTPGRPVVQRYKIDVTIQFDIDRTTTFRLMAEPINGAWECLFGADAEPPKLGLDYHHQIKTSEENGISLEVVQVPLPAVPPEASGQTHSGNEHHV